MQICVRYPFSLIYHPKSEAVAIEVLKQNSWNLEVSVDNYFTNPDQYQIEEPQRGGGQIDPQKIDRLFNPYRGIRPPLKYPHTLIHHFSTYILFVHSDSDSDVIGGEAMERLFADLGVDSEDLVTLILAWQMKAQKLGEFSKQEWTEGMTYLQYVFLPPPFPHRWPIFKFLLPAQSGLHTQIERSLAGTPRTDS